MKKITLSLNYIILLLICQFFLCSSDIFAANTNNFSFDKFEADYYLEKTEDGSSKLSVVENFTAIFPDYAQNKGICRMIPFTNQGGQNITLKSLSSSNLTVLRNGESEPIYSLEKYDNYFEVCTGTEDYLTGTQVYTFKYAFENVITEFDEDGQVWQELYWNTTGTGWQQSFKSVVARVHLPSAEIWDGENWCYVGTYGESGQERCFAKISDDRTIIEFVTENLAPTENLTFAFKIKPNSFIIKETPKSYLPIVILALVIIACIFLIFIPIKKYRQVSNQRKYYKNYFIKPEYQPHKDYSLAELAQIYIGNRSDEKVPLLLDMVVNRRIALIKGDKKTLGGHQWFIKILKNNELKPEERKLLEIINGGVAVSDKETIEIKSHASRVELQRLGKEFSEMGVKEAKKDQLVSEKKHFKRTNSVKTLLIIILCCWLFLPTIFALLSSLTSGNTQIIVDFFNQTYIKNGIIYVWTYPAIAIGVLTIVCLIIVWSCLMSSYNKFNGYNHSGLEASRYLDGLKLYIKMAEKERLELLQSVKGVDTSPQGVVNLYEKLLPYAALFGLEKSWTKELERYYALKDVDSPDWYMANNVIIYMEISRMLHNASTYANAATNNYASSASAGGSGLSGAGGGFSGGGGGGGGGFGR